MDQQRRCGRGTPHVSRAARRRRRRRGRGTTAGDGGATYVAHLLGERDQLIERGARRGDRDRVPQGGRAARVVTERSAHGATRGHHRRGLRQHQGRDRRQHDERRGTIAECAECADRFIFRIKSCRRISKLKRIDPPIARRRPTSTAKEKSGLLLQQKGGSEFRQAPLRWI